MMKISVVAMVPIMTITGLLLKPGLITKGVFITAIIVEFFMAFMASDYYADNQSNFPKPYNVFNKQIYDGLFDYSHFIEVWYGGASSGKSHGVVQKVVLKVLIQFQS